MPRNRTLRSNSGSGMSRSLPSDHPICDVLRLTGQLPSTPTEIDGILEKFSLSREDEVTLTVRKTMGLQYTPLEELDKTIKSFFDDGPAAASIKFAALQSAVLEGELVVDLSDRFPLMDLLIPERIPWNSCKLTTTLLLLYACSSEPDVMLSALKWQSRSLGGLPTMAEIYSTPSADLREQFARAKKSAIDGKIGKVTVLGVSLVDVEMIERGEQKSLDMNYTSFAHSFVMSIGREGFRIYQSWGEHGYRLDQYLMRGGSRCRSWKDAKSFIKMFQKLSNSSGTWSPELKDAYKRCFEVDLDSICGRRNKGPPIVPVYRPWVRLYKINDVSVENIKKFIWRGSI